MASLKDFTRHGRVDHLASGLPTNSVPGAKKDHIYCDADTGTLWVCTDDTPSAQIWMDDKGNFPVLPITSFLHPNLIRLYTGDNISGTTLVDDSPSGLDGTMGAGILQVAGQIGNAVKGDGASIIRANPLVIAGSAPRAFSLIYKPSATTFRAITSLENANAIGQLWYFGISGNATGDIYLDTSTYGVYTSTSGIISSTSTFYHIVINYSGGTLLSGLEIWVNGVQYALNAWSDGTPNTANGFLNIFKNHTSGVIYADTVDMYRVFNRALTSEEIAALYQETGL